MADEDITLENVMGAVKELRTEVEKGHPDLAKIKDIEKFLDEQEEKNQEFQAQEQQAKKREEELQERLDVLEKELARKGGNAAVNYKETPEYKAIKHFIITGEVEEKQLMRTDSDAQGGYLVTAEMDTEITKYITEISEVRSIARVRTVGRKTLEMPVRKTIPYATYEGEAEEGGDDASTYGGESVTTFRQTITVPITTDMLMDSSFNMEAEIFEDANEGMAFGEGRNFVIGDGHKKPQGFTVDDRIEKVDSINSGALNGDDILLLPGQLKTGYDPRWTLNRRTLATIRTLKGTDDHYLWQPGLNGPVGNTLAGDPYTILNDMPDIANNAVPLGYGDFRRGYVIIDRTGIAVIRDEYSRKREAIVEFTIHRWNTGQVVVPEAIKLLRIKP